MSNEKLVKVFGQLTKEHMSTDEDDSDDANVWVSRPPTYRSETMSRFMKKCVSLLLCHSGKLPCFTNCKSNGRE